MIDNQTNGSIRVLIIDDQRSMREIIRRLLRQGGVEDVVEAGSGEEAMELLARQREVCPDVIVSDLHMTGMDGLEFCNRVRRDKDFADRHIPILILTADRDKLMHEVAQQLGAVRVLTKPISANELLDEIQSAVGYHAGDVASVA